MNENVRAHLNKAHERLKDAEADFSLARYAATVNRTYYVMFDAASAALSSIGVECDTHYGVKIKFGELIVKTGKIEPRFGRYLSRAYDLRENADYALDARAEIWPTGNFKRRENSLPRSKTFSRGLEAE